MAKIVIDAGHGGYDNGATFNGRLEKDDNLALALEVGAMLEDDGFDVVYTRTEDIYQTPSEKARIANQSGADYFLSIHRNSSEMPNQYSGVQSLIYDEGGVKQEIGENINANLEKLGFPNLGISIRPNLTVLRRTRMPAVLVEAGFINNDQDNLLFDERFEEIARGIADGVEQAVGPQATPYGATGNDSMTSNSGMMDRGITMNNDGMMGGSAPKYWVQVGLFAEQSNAIAQAARVRQTGHPTRIIMLGDLYTVVAGPYDTMMEASHHAEMLAQEGFDTAVVML